jgi:transcriptional regulator with XRE-family HTH domain
MNAPPEPTPTPPLWREALGRALRLRRTDLGLTLAQVSHRSGVSTQFLSEIERGLKDPSSEVIEAVSIVLGLDLPQVLVLAADIMGAGRLYSATLTSIGSTQAAPAPPARGQVRLALAA